MPVFRNEYVTLLNVFVPPGKNTGYHIHFGRFRVGEPRSADMTNENLGSKDVEPPQRGERGRATSTAYAGRSGPVRTRASNVGPSPFHNVSFIFNSPQPSGFTPGTRGTGYVQVMDNERARGWRLVLESGQSAPAITQAAPGIRIVVSGGELVESVAGQPDRADEPEDGRILLAGGRRHARRPQHWHNAPGACGVRNQVRRGGSPVRRRLVRSMIALAVLAIVSLAPMPGAAQTSATTTYTPPRTPDGQPDLQGIWQVLNTAAWDIQDHGASLGVPAGQGVVEGNEIPYQPAALAKKQENFKNRATLDPETKCYLPGVPAHHLHAVSVSDRSAGRQGRDPLRVRARHSLHLHERESASPWADRLVDGRFARPLGGEYPRRRRDRFQRPDVVRSRREFSQRRLARRRALYADRARSHAL